MVLEHFMVKKELTEAEIAESIPDLWQPLTQQQRELLAQNFTIQKYKKNETIYCEGETPENLMCLLNGKVKIYKDGVGGRSQIIRVIKDKEYFAYRAYFAEENFVTAAAAFEPCTMCLIPMPVIVAMYHVPDSHARHRAADYGKYGTCHVFHQTVVERLGYLRRKNSQPDPETHSRTFGRIIALPERYLRCGRRPVYSEHLSLQRRPGQPLQHDHFQCHPNLIDGRKIKLIDEEKLKKISKIG